MNMYNVLYWILVPVIGISAVGILINSFIIIYLFKSRQFKAVNNLLLLHLGTLNIIVVILFLIYSMPGFFDERWLSDGPLCFTHGSLFTFVQSLTLWTICELNIHRYYTIAAPLHYENVISPRKVFFCMALGWIISFLFTATPFFRAVAYSYKPGYGACLVDFSVGDSGTTWYAALYTAFTLLMPLTLLLICNIRIFLIAREHRHRIASAIFEVTLSAQVTITHQRNPFSVSNIILPTGPKIYTHSAISNILQIVGCFSVIYVPYYSIILWESFATFLGSPPTKETMYILYRIVLLLIGLSPSVNGYLYGLKNKTIRKTFQNYWRKKVTRSELNNEIQGRTPSSGGGGSRRQSLTPTTFFSRPNIQRRLSEACLHSHTEPAANKIKRNISELTWRPKNDTEPVDPQQPCISSYNMDVGDIRDIRGSSYSMIWHFFNDPVGECSNDINLDPGPFPLAMGSNMHSHEAVDDSIATRTKRRFIYRFLRIQESKPPKITITRALSDEEYIKTSRESNKKNTLAVGNHLSKWYYNTEHNLKREPHSDDIGVKAKLLQELQYADDFQFIENIEESTYATYIVPDTNFTTSDEDDTDPSENSTDCMARSKERIEKKYASLNSTDTLPSQSCEVDIHYTEDDGMAWPSCSYSVRGRNPANELSPNWDEMPERSASPWPCELRARRDSILRVAADIEEKETEIELKSMTTVEQLAAAGDIHQIKEDDEF